MTERDEVRAYWQELRGTQRAPQRTDFDPARLAHALPRLLVCEITTRSVRVSGAALRHLWRAGDDFTTAFEAAARPAIVGHLGLMRSFCQPVHVIVAGGTLLCLPMTVGPAVDRFLAHADEGLAGAITPLAVAGVAIVPQEAPRPALGGRPALRVIQGGRA